MRRRLPVVFLNYCVASLLPATLSPPQSVFATVVSIGRGQAIDTQEEESPVHSIDMNSDNDAKHSTAPDGNSAAKPTTNIGIIEDAEATGETAAAYDFWRAGSGRQQVPGIIKCFGVRPDFLRRVIELGNTIHFSEGHLSRRYKEMIASYVSYLNRCPY
jgi:hypothetical protein